MRTLLFLLAIATSIGCSAQYLPFLENGKVWKVYNPAELCGYDKYWIEGDTLIDDRQCYRMYHYELEDYLSGTFPALYTGFRMNRNVSVAYLYEEDGVVYIMVKTADGKDEGRLLYDFSLKCDDHVQFDYGQEKLSYTVTGTSTVDVQGTKRRKIHFDVYDAWPIDWIEGIGGGYALLDPIPYYLRRQDKLYYCGLSDNVYFLSEQLPSIDQFAVNEKRWTYTGENEKVEYFLDGDTVIYTDEEMYHGLKLYKTEKETVSMPLYVGMLVYWNGNYAFMSEDKGMVNLYNFHLKEGESGVFNGHTLVVQQIMTKTFEGHERRVFLLTDEDGNHHQWIDNIGSTTDFLGDIPIETAANKLAICMDQQVEMYNKDHTNAISCTTSTTPTSPTLYDLQGRQLKQKPSKGLCIQGGHIYKQ